MLIRATIASGGVIPHIHKALLNKTKGGLKGKPQDALVGKGKAGGGKGGKTPADMSLGMDD